MNSNDFMKFWFESADSDYETMKVLYNNKKNIWCLFIGHLVIEKLLKGLYAKNNPENPIPPKIHNLILLSQKAKLKVPIEIRKKYKLSIHLILVLGMMIIKKVLMKNVQIIIQKSK